MKNVITLNKFIIPNISCVTEIEDARHFFIHLTDEQLRKEDIKHYRFFVWTNGPCCHIVEDNCLPNLEEKRIQLMADIVGYY